MPNYPLVFIHTGQQRYLKKVIKLAEKYQNKVYLVGDKSNRKYCSNWVDSNELEINKYFEFEKIYRHMSTNRIEFETGCIKRYYLLYAFMNKMNIDSCFMMDSDVCVYSNLENLDFEEYDVACGVVDNGIPNTWCASPHSSFWKKEALKNYLIYLYELYRNKDCRLEKIWGYHQRNNLSGGISDMVLLRLWLNDEKPRWKNLAVAEEGQVFDDNVNCSCNYIGQEYQLRNLLFKRKIKKIIFSENKAFLVNMEGKNIEALIVHAQGEAKMYISCLTKGRNSMFSYYLADIYHEVTTWICHGILIRRLKGE